ncbi:MAG: hypothetical protein AAF436_06260 [Myxococcota bacterium]
MPFRLMFLPLIVAMSGCNPPADYALAGSADVPSTHGDVEVEKIDKKQLLVTIELDFLPAPNQIEPSLTDYAVWFVVVGEDPVLQGVLTYDPAERVGRGSFPTSLREFEMRITAEPSATPAAPNFLLVASQQIREK